MHYKEKDFKKLILRVLIFDIVSKSQIEFKDRNQIEDKIEWGLGIGSKFNKDMFIIIS